MSDENQSNGLPSFDLAEIDAAEEQAQRDRQEAEKMYATIQAAIAYVEKAKGASREALEREPVKTKLPQAQALLEENRLNEIPAVRRRVWQAILGFELTRPLESPNEVKQLLFELAKRRFLREGPIEKSPLRAYGKGYNVSPESLFGEEEIAEVKISLSELCTKVQKAFHRELVQKGRLSWQEILGGKTGSWSAIVPEHIEQRNSTGFRSQGGVIYCEVKERAVFPQQSSGSFYVGPVIVDEGRERKTIGIITKSLTAEKPVFTDYVQDRTQLGHMYSAWSLLRLAALAEEKTEKMQPIKEQFASKKTISREGFFLGGMPGICYIEYEGAWETIKEGKLVSLIPHLFLLIERKEDEGGTKRIRIAEVPDHLREFFAPSMDEYPEKGNRFEGLAQPLRPILMAVWKQVYAAAKDADKAERIAGG